MERKAALNMDDDDFIERFKRSLSWHEKVRIALGAQALRSWLAREVKNMDTLLGPKVAPILMLAFTIIAAVDSANVLPPSWDSRLNDFVTLLAGWGLMAANRNAAKS